jgi:hypothetical protein
VILADDAAEHLPALDRCAERHDYWLVVVGRALLAGLVRPVTVIVAGELAEDDVQVPVVVDQHPVGALSSRGANPPLGITVGSRGSRRGLAIVTPLLAKISSKTLVNLASRSDEEPECRNAVTEISDAVSCQAAVV